jgi:hypothetical protein
MSPREEPEPAVTAEPPPDAAAFASLSEAPGSKIDRYKLLEQIGEGGFGVVFMAEQEFPVRRRVALKIIKLGMDTRQVVARFEAERQALAMMDHPNIAKVLDGGATSTGRPYFVMELVRGIPITEYCDKNKLDIKNRLNLFLQVCHAIQHAHQKGLIHRDLKPGNILVRTQDDQPLAKVIDFGIAKATTTQLTEKTLYTNFHQMVGTPAYMSPEQAQGDFDIDTRCDVYSLGVILYELLVGTPPFDPKELTSKGIAELQRLICEQEPMSPSARLTTLGEKVSVLADLRVVSAAKFPLLLRGELDWIVMRCLEKDRKRRYQTVGELADDIQRHLNDEQVRARPVTAGYRVRKFVRRNRRYVFAAVAMAMALLAGLGLATVGFFRASVERNRAMLALEEVKQQRALADENFQEARGAVEDLLKISDERLRDKPGMQPLRMELMSAAIQRYEPFLSRPMADPTPRAELARLYARHGQLMLEHTEVFDASVLAEFEKARTLQERLLVEHPGDRALRADLGWTLVLEEWRPHEGHPSPVEAGQRAVKIFRQLIAEDPNDPFARDDFIWSLWRLSEYVPTSVALDLINEAIKTGEQLVSEFPSSAEFRRELANALDIKSQILARNGVTPEAAKSMIPIEERMLALKQAVYEEMKSGDEDVLKPERSSQAEARMVSADLMWAEFDIGDGSWGMAHTYRIANDWPHAAAMYEQGTSVFENLVESNPTVATFTEELSSLFRERINAAWDAQDNRRMIAWTTDYITFWNHLIMLHPEQPELQKYECLAIRAYVRVALWVSGSPAPRP